MNGSGRQQARQLAKDNPQLEVVNGGKHITLLIDGRLIGILPYGMRKQGMNQNLRAQLRREGLTVN